MKEFPLGSAWGDVVVFTDAASINGIDIHLAAIAATTAGGETVTGSAGDFCESPASRAYFELLERVSIVRSETLIWALPIKTSTGRECAQVRSDLIAPKSRHPDRWRYSRSNGVALGSSWAAACNRAEWELTERDRVLRSWYGEIPPLRVGLPPAALAPALEACYAFESYLFGPPATSNVEVAGVFGFPKWDEAPFVCGFGARPVLEDAIGAALGECMQRLGFLWGEEIPSERPEMSVTPDFHQEFFLWPGARDRVREWLQGGHQKFGVQLPSRPTGCRGERLFLDVTPEGIAPRLFVAKAIPQGEMRLAFGEGHPDIHEELPEPLWVHPVA